MLVWYVCMLVLYVCMCVLYVYMYVCIVCMYACIVYVCLYVCMFLLYVCRLVLYVCVVWCMLVLYVCMFFYLAESAEQLQLKYKHTFTLLKTTEKNNRNAQLPYGFFQIAPSSKLCIISIGVIWSVNFSIKNRRFICLNKKVRLLGSSRLSLRFHFSFSLLHLHRQSRPPTKIGQIRTMLHSQPTMAGFATK